MQTKEFLAYLGHFLAPQVSISDILGMANGPNGLSGSPQCWSNRVSTRYIKMYGIVAYLAYFIIFGQIFGIFLPLLKPLG